MSKEGKLEENLIAKLGDLKYVYRSDIRDRAALEANFRDHFEALNRVKLTDGEFKRLLDEITEYVRTLETGQPLTEDEVRAGYQRFKEERHAAELAGIADKYGLTNDALQTFVDAILDRMIFDGERLTDLLEPLDLGWRERRKKELALMDDLVPLLKKRTGGRTISGLNAYEQ